MIVNATLANNSLHLHQKLATFPGMFEDIPQNGWQHSLKCLRHIFVCWFGEIIVCLYVCEMFVWCTASAKSLNKVENLQK